MSIKSTKQVAILLGVLPSRVSRIVWEDRITSPEKGPGGNFLWRDADINRASKELLGTVYAPAYAKTTESAKGTQEAQEVA